MRELPQDTLIVFVSDCHVGGDPGCDNFEASEELGSLFEELAMHGRSNWCWRKTSSICS
jgi:hypothetical protein